MGDTEASVVVPASLAVQRRPLLAREFSLLGPAGGLLGRVARARVQSRVQHQLAHSTEQVLHDLNTLGSQWGCLHDVALPTEKIDHLVVGPGGVFAISAHLHPGQAIWVAGETIVVDGQVVPYVRRSREQAAKVSARLSAAAGADVHVTSLVMLVGQKDLEVRRQPLSAPVPGAAVKVAAADDVASWLTSQPEMLTENQIEEFLAAAHGPTTWE